MTDTVFKEKAHQALSTLTALHREAMKDPSYDKINTLIAVNGQLTNNLSRPLLNDERALENLNVGNNSAYGTEESRNRYNEILSEIAKSCDQWSVNVSVTKGIAYTFPRSEKNDSQLESLLEEIHFNKGKHSNPNEYDKRKGTKHYLNGELNFTGFIHQQIGEIESHVDRIKRDGTNIEEMEIIEPFTWIKPAVKVGLLTSSNLKEFSHLIVTKLKEWDAGKIAKSSPAYTLLEQSFITYQKDKGGAIFETYLINRIKKELKKIPL